MKKGLLISALGKFAAGLIAVGLLLFLPAGTLYYPGAWRLAALLFIPMFFVGVVLFAKSPQLLEKRLRSHERENTQKAVVLLTAIIFVGSFIIAALDFRFGWSSIPKPVIYISSALFLLSYAVYVEVMRENAYLSRSVEVQKGQKVIDTGLYGIVRHPMYTATVVMFMSMPLVLGSLWGFAVFLPFPALIIIRIKNEEKVLEEGLEGYRKYKDKVKYRLFPLIW